MTYYHVVIGLKSRPHKGAIKENLSEQDLENTIVKPRNEGKRFECGHETVDPDDISYMKITESQELIHPFMSLDSDYFAELWQTISQQKDVTSKFLKSPSKEKKRTDKPMHISKDIFIVNGRDHQPMKELKTMLSNFGLNPIVLHEQPSGSRTIVEKLEKYSDVGYAFVILTPDDIGVSFQELFEKTAKHSYEDEALEAAKRILKQSKGSIQRFIEFNEKFMQDPSDASEFLQFLVPRARQNVVLEFGYFIGLLGRDRVCCLHKGDVELPSDMHGIVYIPFDDSVKEAEGMIIKELEAAGYEIKI